MKKTKGIIWGIIIIVFGVLWGLKEAAMLDISVIFFDGWWTLFIIIPSLISLFTDKNKTGSLIGIVVGGVLLARYYVDLSAYKAYTLPLVAVIIGVSVIINAVCGRSKKENDGFKKQTVVSSDAHSDSEKQIYYATFGGQDLKFTDSFSGGRFVATFGAVKLDLREADITDGCVVETSATFGGIEILVPYNVKVVANSHSICGGVSDKSNKNHGENAKTIYINSDNLFGGTEIK